MPNLSGQGEFASVRQAFHAIRSALGADAERLTRPQRGLVRFDVTALHIDVLEFDRLAQQSIPEAVGLYRGPLLSGWNETWVLDARQRFQRRFENMIRGLVQRDRRWLFLDFFLGCWWSTVGRSLPGN